MSKKFPKSEITLDEIYSKFADEGYCKDFLLDVRFEKGFACPFCGGSEFRKISVRRRILLQIQPPQAWKQRLFKAFGGTCAVIFMVVCQGDNHILLYGYPPDTPHFCKQTGQMW